MNYCILHQLLLEPYRDLTPTTVQLESNWLLICTKLCANCWNCVYKAAYTTHIILFNTLNVDSLNLG